MTSSKSLPTISVVIPAYNEQDFIGQCLESLSEQELKPLEIIVVDNNSRDQTGAIASGYPLVKVIKEPKQGIVYARNAGFNAARGDIIARCDADSHLSKTWLAHIAATFATDTDLAALTGPVGFHDLPKKWTQIEPVLKQAHVVGYFKGTKVLLGHEALFGSNMAIRRPFWLKIKDQVCLDESKMHEDTDLAVHVSQAGGTIKYDPNLQATMSMRRLKSDQISYLQRWIKTGMSHSSAQKAKRSES
ncbi:MAG TPA: glycosyltransferase family 2 protein [Candidatus Saccharimonadales bacterium]|nr:glycosyltransferase family 2 protein [Candidatus Saccharimonadales bacterium]